MNNLPKISIIISTFNSVGTLQSCLDSIFAQIYSNIEIVIVDGGSSDGTVALLEANTDKLGAWKSEPDKGIYDAWNKALDMVSGDWVYFIGGDDVLHAPTSIDRAVDRFAQAPETTLIAYGMIRYIDATGHTVTMGEPWEAAGPKMRAQMSLPHQGVFHARELFKRFGSFDGDFQIAGDYKLIMQSLGVVDPFFLGDVIVADQNAGGKSSLRKNRVAALMEFRKVQSMLGYSMSPSWIFALSKGIFWKWLDIFGFRV